MIGSRLVIGQNWWSVARELVTCSSNFVCATHSNFVCHGKRVDKNLRRHSQPESQGSCSLRLWAHWRALEHLSTALWLRFAFGGQFWSGWGRFLADCGWRSFALRPSGPIHMRGHRSSQPYQTIHFQNTRKQACQDQRLLSRRLGR